MTGRFDWAPTICVKKEEIFDKTSLLLLPLLPLVLPFAGALLLVICLVLLLALLATGLIGCACKGWSPPSSLLALEDVPFLVGGDSGDNGDTGGTPSSSSSPLMRACVCVCVGGCV